MKTMQQSSLFCLVKDKETGNKLYNFDINDTAMSVIKSYEDNPAYDIEYSFIYTISDCNWHDLYHYMEDHHHYEYCREEMAVSEFFEAEDLVGFIESEAEIDDTIWDQDCGVILCKRVITKDEFHRS